MILVTFFTKPMRREGPGTFVLYHSRMMGKVPLKTVCTLIARTEGLRLGGGG